MTISLELAPASGEHLCDDILGVGWTLAEANERDEQQCSGLAEREDAQLWKCIYHSSEQQRRQRGWHERARPSQRRRGMGACGGGGYRLPAAIPLPTAVAAVPIAIQKGIIDIKMDGDGDGCSSCGFIFLVALVKPWA